MKAVKSVFGFFFAIMIVVAMAAGSTHAGSCPDCTVTVANETGGTANITLVLSNGESIPVNWIVNQSIPTKGYCPTRLQGSVTMGAFTAGITKRCLKDGAEGTTACSEDCRSSSWKIQGASSGGYHFYQQ